jgi:hypothetical protein
LHEIFCHEIFAIYGIAIALLFLCHYLYHLHVTIVYLCHFSPAAAGQKILDHLAKIQKMEQRVKDQEERDSATSSPAHQPSIERSDSSSSETRRRHSANRLQRQDVSVREGT